MEMDPTSEGPGRMTSDIVSSDSLSARLPPGDSRSDIRLGKSPPI